MTVTGCARAAKYILVILNVLVLCAGAIAIGLGAWALASEYGAEKLKDLTGSELYRGAAIAVIVGGGILVIISFFGAFGAMCESKWMLGIYFVIMLLLLILFVVAAAVGFAYKDRIEEELNKQMKNSLLNNYGVDVDKNDDNYDLTQTWDNVQKSLECCGVQGGLNSSDSWVLWQSSQWYMRNTTNMVPLVPASCCKSGTANITCQMANPLTLNRPPQRKDMSLMAITEVNPALNHEGCLTKLYDYIFDHIIAIGGIAIAILIVMVISIVLAVCLCTNIRRSKLSD